MVDGYLARKYHLVTYLGSMLDPLADKLMMLTVLISLLVSGQIPWLVALIAFVRDAGMIISSIFFHFKGKKAVPANKFGKLTTVMFYIAVLFIIFKLPFYIEVLWFVVSFSFITSIVYLFEFRKMHDMGKKNAKRAATISNK